MPSVNPQVLRWARETAGLTVEEAADALGIASADRLRSLEAGTDSPSRPVLVRMAKQYRRSLLTFYLPLPPPKGKRGEDYRTLPDRGAAPDGWIDALMRDLNARQNLVRTALEDEEQEPLSFVGSVAIDAGVDAVRKSILKTLAFDVARFRERRTSESAFAYLRECAESAGIFVLLVGNLGSHHTSIPVEAFRGIAISDRVAPFVVVNDQDAKTAWSFTLLHEIAHIWLGTTGVSGLHSELTIEKFCNDVSSEILLPAAELRTLTLPKPFNAQSATDAISDFAGDRNLSRLMVAYRLYGNGALTRPGWLAVEAELHKRRERERASKKSTADSGPNYYVVKRHRLGNALLNFAVRSLDAGTLSAVKAAKVLGVKPRAVFPLLTFGEQS